MRFVKTNRHQLSWLTCRFDLRKSLAGVFLSSCLWAIGCQSKPTPEKPPVQTESQTEGIANSDLEAGSNQTTHIAQKVANVDGTDGRFHLTFEEAMILDHLPEDQFLPPDRTMAGKPTGLLREEVEKQWKQIKLTDSTSQLIPYQVTIQTSRGEIELELHSDLAPNHVKNFLALCQAGYYDNLCFDRTVRQEYQTEDQKKHELQLIRAGCPLGTGEEGIGHLGYFLKPEISKTEKHHQGSVGFWRDRSARSACCRFYITLSDAPMMDGEFTIFAHVVRGLEIIQAIAVSPVHGGPNEVDTEKPLQPTKIQKVVVTPKVGKP